MTINLSKAVARTIHRWLKRRSPKNDAFITLRRRLEYAMKRAKTEDALKYQRLKRYRSRAQKKGLCVACGKPRRGASLSFCETCRLKANAVCRRYYERKLQRAHAGKASKLNRPNRKAPTKKR